MCGPLKFGRSVVYFDQLLGTARTRKLVKTFFEPFSTSTNSKEYPKTEKNCFIGRDEKGRLQSTIDRRRSVEKCSLLCLISKKIDFAFVDKQFGINNAFFYNKQYSKNQR